MPANLQEQGPPRQACPQRRRLPKMDDTLAEEIFLLLRGPGARRKWALLRAALDDLLPVLKVVRP